MKHHIGLEVGQQYRNRKGNYEVLALDEDAMRIHWETGEEIDTTVKLQSRILDHTLQGSGQPPSDRQISTQEKRCLAWLASDSWVVNGGDVGRYVLPSGGFSVRA